MSIRSNYLMCIKFKVAIKDGKRLNPQNNGIYIDQFILLFIFRYVTYLYMYRLRAKNKNEHQLKDDEGARSVDQAK